MMTAMSNEVVTVSYPTLGPAEPEGAISLHQVQLAQFFGDQGEKSPGQDHLERLEDWLRSHAVGGSNRKSEGLYGQKTRDLVNSAYEHYLNKEGNGVVGQDLWNELKAAGAPVVP